ncbi:MAG TPA: DHH family phosphoesterase [Candidatus Saccharimonadales bacterium]|nr:DHH family phosphoesterase [Candidatus Saccharimonadales bacterium]
MSKLVDFIDRHDSFVVIQAENPDGDSLGSALGLEAIIAETGKSVQLYCPVEIPKYLRYVNGWDRVEADFPTQVAAAIIVDTSSSTLLSKTLDDPVAKHFLTDQPVLVVDHHAVVGGELTFDHDQLIDTEVVATGELIAKEVLKSKLKLPEDAATALTIAILSDSLGLTTEATTAASYRTIADLVQHGAKPAEIESARREFMKKSADILAYKGRLIGRIEYHLDGRLALVHIPWEEIEAYSDQYNPSVLVLDEMRLVEGVDVAVAIKTYPDGKLTGKLRSNRPVSSQVAGFFGGGGHPYAAGFRIYESYDNMLPELVEATRKALS